MPSYEYRGRSSEIARENKKGPFPHALHEKKRALHSRRTVSYFKTPISKARMRTTATRSRATGSPGLRYLPVGSS